MEEDEEACSNCSGQVEYDEFAHSYVCIECGSTSTKSVRLVSQELLKDVGVHRRVLQHAKTDNRAFERRVQKFASGGISISHKLGDISATLNTDMVNFARKTLSSMPDKPVPQVRTLESFGIAAAYLRAKQKGIPVTLNDVAAIADVSPKVLYAGYKRICDHTNTNTNNSNVPLVGTNANPTNSTENTFFVRFQPVAKKLIPNSWKLLSQSYSNVLRIIQLFYNKSSRSRLFITAISIMFAIRAIACEQLEPSIPSAAQCAHEISRCGIANMNTISRKSLEVEYRYLEKEIKKSLMDDDDDEVHASFSRIHNSLFEKCDGAQRDWKVKEGREAIVASIREGIDQRRRKRKEINPGATPGTKRRRTHDENGLDDCDDSDDSEIDEAVLTEVEVEKRARSLGINYTSPVTD